MSASHDRKNQQIWEFIDVASYKQALQQCNRRIKKGEKGDYLMLLKAHILTLMPPVPSGTNYDEALNICRNIAQRQTPVVNDVAIAVFLQRVWSFLADVGAGGGREECSREVSRVWEGVVKTTAKGDDETAAREWVLGCVRMGNWRGMQKAAMNLQKTFPKQREHYFWAVISCLLLYNSLPETSNERKLFGTLAYRMVIKSKEEVPPEQNNITLPARAIHSSQELHLLLTVIDASSPLTSRGRLLEALAIFDSKNLGLESTIAKGDYLGLLRRKLSLLRKAEKWVVLWGFCGELLRKARSPKTVEEEESTSEMPKIGDDWSLWENYLTAAGKLLGTEGNGVLADGVSVKEKTLQTIKGYTSPEDESKPSRNSELAFVKFTSLFYADSYKVEMSSPPAGIPSLVGVCKRYFDHMGNKNCCFEDLGRYVQLFDEAEQEDFLSYLKGKGIREGNSVKVTVSWIAEQINYQKFVYFCKISPSPLHLPDGHSSISTMLTEYAATNLNIYLAALEATLSSSLVVTDNQYGDDAALLAVMALFRLWKLDESSEIPLLRAIFILETVLTKSKHNYQALLLLTRLYLLIGAPYLAASVECWGRLNVKPIQTDALGHWLLNRGTTMFPSALVVTPDGKSSIGSDLVNHLEKNLNIYGSSRKQTPDMCVLALDRGSYGQLLEFVKFGKRLESSISRGIYEVDRRRVERLRSVLCAGEGEGPCLVPWRMEMLEADSTKVTDNRDFTILVSFEKGKKNAEELFLRIGSELPRRRWVRGFSLVEELVEIGGGIKLMGQGKQLGEIETTLGEVLKTDEQEGDILKAEFTEEEKVYLTLARLLAKFAASVAVDPSNVDPAECLEHIGVITSFFKPETPLTLPEIYSWRTLHATWTRLESSLLAFLVLTKGVKTQVNKLKGSHGQKVKQALQQLLGVVIPEYVKFVKHIFGKRHVQGVGEAGAVVRQVLEGNGMGDALGEVLKQGKVFCGEEGVAKVLEKVGRGRREGGEGIKRWILPSNLGGR